MSGVSNTPSTRDVKIDPETASLGVAIGLFRAADSGDGVLTTTIMGDAWLRQWCEQRLRELEERGRV